MAGGADSEVQVRVLDGVQRGLRRDLAGLQLAVGPEHLEVEPPRDIVPDQPDLSPMGGGAGLEFTLHAYRCTTVEGNWLATCDESYEFSLIVSDEIPTRDGENDPGPDESGPG